MMGKDQELFQAVKEQDIILIHKLLHRGRTNKNKIIGSNKKLNVNHQGNDGMAALHQAALVGNVEIMQALLESGASVDVKDNKGMRPLHYAAWQGREDPVKLLLKWGSSATEPAQEGESPLHLACQHGHYDVVSLLLCYHADPTCENKQTRTPIDLACEFGRYRVVELLLSSNLCNRLLQNSPNDTLDNSRTTCLHLAAKNGHSDILRLLLYAGVDINRTTLQGTCLHEAALCGKIDIVKILLDCGVDVNRSNSYDQTALDIVNRFTTSRAAKELKQLLKEAPFAVPAQAIQDYSNYNDPNAITFKEGDFIQVLEQAPDGVWKGYLMQDSQNTTGYFPATAVDLVDKQIAVNRSISMKPSHTRKPPLPHSDLIHRSHLPPPPSVSSQYSSIGHDDAFPPPPSPLIHQNNRSPSHSRSESLDSAHHYNGPPTAYGHPQIPYTSGKFSPGPVDQVDWSNRFADPGDMRSASPNRDSPVGSNRNSAASSDSGRSVGSSSYDGKGIHNYVNIQLSQHRLSGQSYESGVSSRQSYHSTSSSSLGSLDRLEESGYSSQVNVAELVQSGMSQDHEIIHAWLTDLHYEEYYNNFIMNGYDMGTISRMTPEDLTAIGITKPGHRKRLKSEIARLHIPDGIPDFRPVDLHEWLQVLNLLDYHETLSKQGYENLDLLTDITWEDLEEIGIKKLGHQKKIVLAIDRLKRLEGGKRQSVTMERRGSSEMLDRPQPVHHPYPQQSMPARWPSDMASNPSYGHEMFKQRKSPSGESLNSGHELKSFQQTEYSGSSEMISKKPDFVAITVGRTRLGSSDSGRSNSPVMFQSFHGPIESEREGEMTPTNERSSTPDNIDRDSLTRRPAAVVSPRISNKPKPVAMIVAKTRRGSRDVTPEIISVDKPDPEFDKSSDHIYENPDVTQSKNSSSPGPGSPKSTTPPPYSYLGKSKKPPPPPPKRTNSISKENLLSDIVDESEDAPVQMPEPLQMTELQTSSSCVRSLADRFQHHNSEDRPVLSKFKELKKPSHSFESVLQRPPQPPVVPQDSTRTPPVVKPKPTPKESSKPPESPKIHEVVKPKEVIRPKESPKVKEFPKVKEKPAPFSQDSTSTTATTSNTASAVVQNQGPGLSDGEEEIQTIRRVKVKRNESTTSIDSNVSTCSTDSNTLPFANENVGTIKQRNAASKPSVVQVDIDTDEPNLNSTMFEETATMKRRPMPQAMVEKGATSIPSDPTPRIQASAELAALTADYPDTIEDALVSKRPSESGDVLNDIGNMLQDLTDELDAMLDVDVDDS